MPVTAYNLSLTAHHSPLTAQRLQDSSSRVKVKVQRLVVVVSAASNEVDSEIYYITCSRTNNRSLIYVAGENKNNMAESLQEEYEERNN